MLVNSRKLTWERDRCLRNAVGVSTPRYHPWLSTSRSNVIVRWQILFAVYTWWYIYLYNIRLELLSVCRSPWFSLVSMLSTAHVYDGVQYDCSGYYFKLMHSGCSQWFLYHMDKLRCRWGILSTGTILSIYCNFRCCKAIHMIARISVLVSVSTALIGVKVSRAIISSRNGIVAAVASRQLEKAEKFSEELGLSDVRTYGNYDGGNRDKSSCSC